MRTVSSLWVIGVGFWMAHSVWASTLNNVSVASDQVQNAASQNSVLQKATMWGLSTEEYQQYLMEMHNTPAGTWWKNIDPPQVLGMNANTENERMKFALLDVQLDHDRALREIAFQHAYSKAFAELYPNARLIAINTSQAAQAANIHNGDRYYLFTAIDDPEGGMLSSKMMSLLAHKSDVSVNIFFVGAASFSAIQTWAKGNNLPITLPNHNILTLNHNEHDGSNMLHKVLGTTNVSLPVLVRVRGGESAVVAITSI